jgi:APA family basic amino acid/polyamine antiporter
MSDAHPPAAFPLGTTASPLRRQLGLAAVGALVVGDMLGSGIFFTPGELASSATAHWQVYFIWALCGFITLCGALTVAELCARRPQAGASYHIIREAFGPFWGFLAVWIQLWVSGPGSIAGLAVVFGEFASRATWGGALSPVAWGAGVIVAFAVINTLGVQWGGRTQVTLTAVKVLGLVALVGGSLWLAAPAPAAATAGTEAAGGTLESLVRLVGLGVAAVLFTYDGWLDVSHVAGEVDRPERTLPLGMGAGVLFITGLYLVVNHAFLRVVPLEAMREAPVTIAARVADATFGPTGGPVLEGLIIVAIAGATGGLVMTVPRLFYTVAAANLTQALGPLRLFFASLSTVSARTAVPVQALWFTAIWSVVALAFFGSFSRLVTFLVVPLQLVYILTVAAVFRARRDPAARPGGFRVPGYPLTPLVYIVVLSALLVSTAVFQPLDTLIGLVVTATGVPVYAWMVKRPA